METNFDYFDAILSKESKKRKKETIEYIELNNLSTTENQSLLNPEINTIHLSPSLINIITRKDFLYFISGLAIVIIFLTLLYLYDKV